MSERDIWDDVCLDTWDIGDACCDEDGDVCIVAMDECTRADSSSDTVSLFAKYFVNFTSTKFFFFKYLPILFIWFQKNVCTYCFKTFPFPSQLKTHLVSHTKERQFHCDYCNASYHHRSHLNRHIRTSHKSHTWLY